MKRKPKSRKEIADEAAEAYSDLNVFYCVIGLLENGTVRHRSYRAAERIITICKNEGQKRLEDYDRAIAALEKQP